MEESSPFLENITNLTEGGFINTDYTLVFNILIIILVVYLFYIYFKRKDCDDDDMDSDDHPSDSYVEEQIEILKQRQENNLKN